MFKKIVLFSLALILFFTACTAKPGAQLEQKSNKPHDPNPVVADEDLKTLAADNTTFAFDLYRQLKSDETGNFFYSPYSISQALAMTYAGAAGSTAQQMAAALHFGLQGAQLHPAFNKLALELASRSEIKDVPADQQFRLNVANSIWGQQGQGFLPDFLDTLAVNYGAGLQTVDFTADPEGIRKNINDWVAQQTADKIKDLIPQGAIDTLTRMVLANAIYFNASWQDQFEKSQTRDGEFILQGQNVISVPMMHQTESFGTMSGDGYRAVVLPYVGNQLSMMVIVPDYDQFADVESRLSPGFLDAILANLQFGKVKLGMPKFKIETSFELEGALTALGMPDAFDPERADFSAMDGKKDLYIGAVVHKAYVSMDENGTEAAAATAVIMEAMAMPVEPLLFDVDRPFIFVIRDNPTGTILFVGRVTNPLE